MLGQDSGKQPGKRVEVLLVGKDKQRQEWEIVPLNNEGRES